MIITAKLGRFELNIKIMGFFVAMISMLFFVKQRGSGGPAWPAFYMR